MPGTSEQIITTRAKEVCGTRYLGIGDYSGDLMHVTVVSLPLTLTLTLTLISMPRFNVGKAEEEVGLFRDPPLSRIVYSGYCIYGKVLKTVNILIKVSANLTVIYR